MKLIAALSVATPALFLLPAVTYSAGHPAKKHAAPKSAAVKPSSKIATSPPVPVPPPPAPTVTSILDKELDTGDLLVVTSRAGKPSIIEVVGMQGAQFLAAPVHFEAVLDYWGNLARLQGGTQAPTHLDPSTSPATAIWLLTVDTDHRKPVQDGSGKAYTLDTADIKSIQRLIPPVLRRPHFGGFSSGQNQSPWTLILLWISKEAIQP